MTTHTMLWRRIDAPGHDACRLELADDGWRVRGTAVFQHQGAPARLDYQVTCDRAWQTRRGRVEGWAGGEAVAFSVEHAGSGRWSLDGVPVPGLHGCVDLDLGFTPATNLLQIRRIALAVGEAADVPVAWLDVPGGTLSRLDQRYEHLADADDAGETPYAYAAPRFGYRAVLAVDEAGFARRYPGLWEAER